MIRATALFALLIAGMAIAAPVRKPAPTQDWRRVARVTPADTVVIGNPAARVKLIEYLSFTCPHCAAFAKEATPILKDQMIRSGQVSLEYRPTLRDQLDLGAAIIARCAGPAKYAAAEEAIFARQDVWLPLGFNFLEREMPRFASEKPIERIRIAAQSIGLYDIAHDQGLTDPQIAACFANPKLVNAVLKVGDEAQKIIRATPSFFANGADTNVHDWAALEPLLRAQGVK